MQFVSVYTLPAYNMSIWIFKESKTYFFSNFWEWKYNLEEINKSSYIWLWTPYKAEIESSEWNMQTNWYVNIKYIWEILEVKEFNIEVVDNKIVFLDWDLTENQKKAFIKQSDQFYKLDNWDYISTIPSNMHLIEVKEVIEVKEDILHPKRKTIALALNLDNNSNYIELTNFLDTIKITDEILLNIKKEYLIKNWEKIKITWTNSFVYTLILKNIFLSEERSFSISNFIKECKSASTNFSSDYNYLNSSLARWFNKFFKDKLPFEIGFSKTKEINWKEESYVFYLK